MKLLHSLFRKSALMLTVILASGLIYSQTVIIGKVTSVDDNSPVSGANVVLKGTSKGVLADPSGNYTIQVNGPSDVLVFSFAGFNTEEIQVGSQTIINAEMVSDIKSQESVVVMGYSTKKKSEITSAGATVWPISSCMPPLPIWVICSRERSRVSSLLTLQVDRVPLLK